MAYAELHFSNLGQITVRLFCIPGPDSVVVNRLQALDSGMREAESHAGRRWERMC
jgi:hypothetical protein